MGDPALSMLPLGARIAGRYVVCGRVGRGGMGEVYEVEHTLLGRRFALKRMSDGATDRRLIERFLREARAAAATGHAGIVEVFDLGFTEDGLPFLVMELLRGETLRERLRRGRLDDGELIHLARSVLAALDAVHRRSIVHRDIKPENLYLCTAEGERPRVKILDFGLAQLQAGDGGDFRLTQSGAVMGTPLYMSPEQARGIDLDPRTDLYALGAVLYECAAGQPPFRAETYSALVLRIVEDAPDAARLAGVSERLRAGILRALAKRPEERFADATTMRTALCGDAAPAGAPVTLGAPLGPRASSSKPTLVAPHASATAETLAETPILAIEVTQEAQATPPAQATRALRLPPEVEATRAARVSPVVETAPAPDGEATPAATGSVTPAATRSATPAVTPAATGSATPAVTPAATGSATPAATGSVTPAATGSATPAATGSVTPAPTVRRPRRRAGLILAGALAVLAAAAAVAIAVRGRGSHDAAVSSDSPDIEAALARGDLDGVAELLRRAALRRPDDLLLRGRELLVAIAGDRQRAYAIARDLGDRALPPPTAEAVTAARAVEHGDPAAGAAALSTLAAQRPDDLALRFAEATLLRLADDVEAVQTAMHGILERWPAFHPAVEVLLQYLLFQGDAEAARRIVDRYAAAAPEGPAVVMVEIEMLIGERRYSDALARVDKLLADSPGLEHELYQFKGDLLILLGDPEAAIAAYDAVDDPQKRNNYVSGGLLELGRVAEARSLMLSTIEGYPPQQTKLSRLAKVAIDATLLALETGDAELATRTATALGGREADAIEMPARSALAFARAVAAQLGGGPIDAGTFPLGERSPLYILLQARAVRSSGGDALPLLLAATAPQGLKFSTVPTHIYPALWLARAEAAHARGLFEDALTAVDVVLRPRHYDSSRGVVVRRAMRLRVEILDALGRAGEARAVERELAARFAD